ncbi:unnamed protein product [Clonostachys byssicola]|uniref:Major facilitator superfamily (MFS) profile domain-containing protein n=1 Tax=Clonostachys byssicola TaxID=160290 RepID=A0A9N9UPK1_9HYPO|nr:unnamed protein product [Clonostachys byssicola]
MKDDTSHVRFAPSRTCTETSQSSTKEDTSSDRPGFRIYAVSVVLALSVLMVGLDASIVATANPKITDDFNSLADVGWYGSAFQLTVCATQLSWGKVYMLFPVKRVFIGSVFLFEVGSLISAAAPSSSVFIAGRAISGVGSAGMTGGSLLIIAQCVPLQSRPTFIAMIGAMEAIGYIMGPLLGGAITDKASWRWCFWINLPVGAITAIVMQILLKPPQSKSNMLSSLTILEKLRRFDWFGALTLSAGILSLILALQWGGSKYSWTDARIIVCLVFGALLLTIFFVIQTLLSQEKATIPLRVMKSRSVVFGTLYSFSLSSALAIWTYYLPLWFQGVKDASALDTGVMLLPAILGLVMGVVVGSLLVTRIGYYTPFAIVSGILATVAAGLLTRLEVHTPQPEWIGYLIFIGISCGLGFQQPQIAVQTVLEDSDVPAGTSLIFFSQSVGSAIFISLGNSIFLNRLIVFLKETAPEVSSDTLLSHGATTLKTAVPSELVETVVVAYNNAISHVFFAPVGMCILAALLSLGIEFKSIKTAKKTRKPSRRSLTLSYIQTLPLDDLQMIE